MENRITKVSAVIVNYNDSRNTKALAEQLLSYKVINVVVVVDNASTDDSINVLKNIKDPKFLLVKNKINAGYGEGNNLGIIQSKEKFNCTHCLIINPDVEISELVITKMLKVFESNSNAMIIAPSTFAFGKRMAWHVRGFKDLVLSKGKILGRLLNVPFYCEEYFEGKDLCRVDAVLGACLMVELEKFFSIGMYDKNMFLYEEEDYLAIRCKEYNYETIVLCNDKYIHNHKSDNKKSLSKQLETKKHMCNSLRYMLKRYENYGLVKLFITDLILIICRFEVIASYLLKKGN